ncbi:substrate-binding domain-containing protein [Pseudomonas sp. UBA1879]|uniref:substrate-binding domain-containing protein n=1 Tax=Pseudomonas sp. UBA1879 TaxID=1947305 RepID=UPI0025D4A49D|nr:substrate-binding domain-containing protein [Pseudomonas sp. UBA1879]
MNEMDTSRPSITLMSTLAIQGALVDVIIPKFELLTGIKVNLQLDPTNVLIQRIHGGERADMIVAVSADITSLEALGVLTEKGTHALVTTCVGLGIQEDSRLFPLASVDDLKTALIEARSVVYSRTGASGVYFASLLERLGIAAQVNARATIVEKGLTGESVVSGVGDIAVQQLSELAIVRGLKTVGPLPEGVGHVTQFSVGRFAADQHNLDVQLLSDWLVSPTAQAAYEQYGLSFQG